MQTFSTIILSLDWLWCTGNFCLHRICFCFFLLRTSVCITGIYLFIHLFILSIAYLLACVIRGFYTLRLLRSLCTEANPNANGYAISFNTKTVFFGCEFHLAFVHLRKTWRQYNWSLCPHCEREVDKKKQPSYLFQW